ncbi:GTP-binding protein [Legionella jamestowniensis]|uniref:Ras family GTPase n=1 Tax=Legionella jamestowniensis TaxID=455 RepID=A0A0W0UGB3_9GAMM|nr:GTP-binding protein [Legionella jamestowniensis]KTD06932.1 Ras family GTPase [Legionella jamestowniensis]SFL84922.1 GTPase SAR1 family protein [Legionella jamestowniensis DSM 19215]
MKIEYLQKKIDFIKEVYELLQQTYDSLSIINDENKKQKEFNKLLKINEIINNKTTVINSLEEKLKTKKSKNDQSSAEYIDSQVKQLLDHIISVSCPDSSHSALKNTYRMLTKTLSTSLLGSIFSSPLKKFDADLKNYCSHLTKAFRLGQRTIEQQLPEHEQKKLMQVRAGEFQKLPQDIIGFITSLLPTQALCKLSETGHFFKKMTFASRKIQSEVAPRKAPQINVTLIGDSRIGIRSLISQLTKGIFQEFHIGALEEKHFTGGFLLNYQSPLIGGRDYSATINSDAYINNQYRRTNIFLLCFDISARASFDNLAYWYKEVVARHTTCQFLLVGLKSDLAGEREITQQEAQKWADTYQMDYIETSAKTGVNLHELENKIIKMHKQVSHSMKEETSRFKFR